MQLEVVISNFLYFMNTFVVVVMWSCLGNHIHSWHAHDTQSSFFQEKNCFSTNIDCNQLEYVLPNPLHSEHLLLITLVGHALIGAWLCTTSLFNKYASEAGVYEDFIVSKVIGTASDITTKKITSLA